MHYGCCCVGGKGVSGGSLYLMNPFGAYTALMCALLVPTLIPNVRELGISHLV